MFDFRGIIKTESEFVGGIKTKSKKKEKFQSHEKIPATKYHFSIQDSITRFTM